MLYTPTTTNRTPKSCVDKKNHYLCIMDCFCPHTVAFTGHRSYSRRNDSIIEREVKTLYDIGARRFRVGMAEGFDLAAACVVLMHKREHPDIVLEIFIPWHEFATTFSTTNRHLYNLIVAQASEIHYISEEYHLGVYQERNEAMVDGSDLVVAWWNHKPSGTANTIRYARKVGCPVKNIFDFQQLELDI